MKYKTTDKLKEVKKMSNEVSLVKEYWKYGSWEKLNLINDINYFGNKDKDILLLIIASSHFQSGNFEQCKSILKDAVKSGASHRTIVLFLISILYNQVAKANAVLGDAAKAREYFLKSIQIFVNDSTSTLVAKGRMLEQLVKLNEIHPEIKINYLDFLSNNGETKDNKVSLDNEGIDFVRCGLIDNNEIYSLANKKFTLKKEKHTFGNWEVNVYIRDGNSDKNVVQQILLNKDYDFDWLPQGKLIRSLYRQILKSGKKPVIIDAGANIGVSVNYFLGKFPSSRVVAIEPEENNFLILKLNCVGKDVLALEGGVSDKNQKLYLDDPGHGDWGFTTNLEGSNALNGYGMTEIISNTIKDKESLLFVKIDIEGAEDILFRSNIEWVRKVPLIIIELHDWLFPGLGKSYSFYKVLANHNFEIVPKGENLLCFNVELIY